MYFIVNFNVFFKLIKVHLLVSELYVYQNARCIDKKKWRERGLDRGVRRAKFLIFLTRYVQTCFF